MAVDITNSLYTRFGGETILREFVNHLYDHMDDSPEVTHIRAMHSVNLSETRDKLFMFLSGMLGGPSLYMDAFGPPRLRRKHLHFEIGNVERDQWLLCAQHAANQLDIEGHLREQLMIDLTVMANHLRNKDAINTPCLPKTA